MRRFAVLFALAAASCSTTWDAFRVVNQEACTNSPLDCGSGKVCSYQTRQCQPQSCRQDGLCWESPRPQLFQPRALFGKSASEIWMIGTREIYRISGTTVTPVIADLPARLNAIVGVDGEHVFFLGDSGTVLRWNGSRLLQEQSGVVANLLGGWGDAPDNIWAAGEGGTLLHKDGAGWQTVATSTSATLTSVIGTTEGVFVAAGNGSVLRWDGSALSAEMSSCAGALLGITQAGSDLVSVGEGYCMTRRRAGTWSALPSLSTPPTDKTGYFSVVGSLGSSIYVSGRPGTLHKLDGATWSQLELNTMAVARGLLPLSQGEVWIGGSDLYRISGNLPTRINARPQETLYAISGATPDTVWATGFAGTVLRRTGTSWEPIRSEATTPLYGVYSPSADLAFAIGFDASGSSLSRCTSKGCSIIEKGGAGADFTSIHGVDADNYWVVGKAGVLKTWSKKADSLTDETTNLPKGASLNHVFAIPASSGGTPTVYAVGEQGLVMVRGSMGWLQESAAPTGKQNLLAVWGSSASDVWVGGSSGLIAHYDGTGWAVIPTGSNETIIGLAGTAANDVWAVTVQGSILRYDGQRFTVVSRDELPSLQAIVSVGGHLFVAGALGTILHKAS